MSNRVIYRFPIPYRDIIEGEGFFELELPRAATLLHLDVQQRAPHDPCIWALCAPDEDPVKRKFLLVGTGQAHPSLNGSKWQNYIGSYQQEGFVFHVWEVPT